MEIYVLNKKFEKIAVIDEVDSILWNKSFLDVGYCEIHSYFNAELFDVCKRGYYLKRLDDDMLCEIVRVSIDTNVQDGDYLTIYALDVKSILNRRIVWNDITYKGQVAWLIKKIIDDNFIAPKTSARKITNFIFDSSNLDDFPEEISDFASNHENVLNLITDLCNDNGYGFKITLDSNNNFVMKLLRKVDKSHIENDEYIEFSPDFANIISSNYLISDESFKNKSLVSGEKKDGEAQQFGEFGDASGLDRREVFNESGVSKTYKDDAGVEHTYTDAEYKSILNNIAKLKLLDNRTTETFEGEVDVIDTYKYKDDYDIGDVVFVVNEYGIGKAATITSVLEREDNDSGYVVEPQFEY